MTDNRGRTPRGSSSESSHPNIYKALSHPLRMRMLTALSDREASPKELSVELGEPLGNVAYHMRMLEELGCIELVRTTPRRGAVEHHYRLIVPPTIGADEWARLPQAARSAISAATLSEIVQDLVHAQELGTFDRHPARHLSHTTLALDDQGWAELSRLLTDLSDRALELQAESAGRIAAEGGEPPPASKLAMLHFEAAPRS